MNNPLVGGMPMMNGPIGNMSQIIQNLNKFRQSFNGNPQEQIQQLLNSGKVSQKQYNDAYQMAQQIQKMMGGK